MRRLFEVGCVAAILVLVTMGGAHGQYTQDQYNLRYIGAPNNGAGSSQAFDVNDDNFVVGWQSTSETGLPQAIYWYLGLTNPDSTPANFRPAVLALPGSTASVAMALNNTEQIVGYGVFGGVERPVRWLSPTDPGVALDATWVGRAQDIDEQGNIVGYRLVSGVPRAFFRAASGLVTTLPDPPPIGSVTFANNASHAFSVDSGDPGSNVYACGFVTGSDGQRFAARWTLVAGNWTAQALPKPPNATGESIAYGVNRSGQMVGFITFTSLRRAFLSTAGTNLVELGSLDGGIGSASSAFAINDNGRLVGESQDFGVTRPFVIDLDIAGQPGPMLQINFGRASSEFGYTSGQIRSARGLNNFETLSPDPNLSQVPSIALIGRANSNQRSQAVVARAITFGDGNPGLAIGGVRSTVLNLNPGASTDLTLELQYLNRTGNGTYAQDQRAEISPTGQNAPRIDLIGPGISEQIPVTIPINSSTSTAISRSFTRQDAGKRIEVRGVFGGYNRPSVSTFVFVNNLPTKLVVLPATGTLAGNVTLQGTLTTNDAQNEPLANQEIQFEVSYGGDTFRIPATTNASGVATTNWNIDPRLGVGVRTLRAVYSGRLSGDTYPYFAGCGSNTTTLTTTANATLALALDNDFNTSLYAVRPGQRVLLSSQLNVAATGAPIRGAAIHFLYSIPGFPSLPIKGSPVRTDDFGMASVYFDVPGNPANIDYLITAVFWGDGAITGAHDNGVLLVRANGDGRPWTLSTSVISAGHGRMSVSSGTPPFSFVDGTFGEPIVANPYLPALRRDQSISPQLVMNHGFWANTVRAFGLFGK
ncbi:MAG TPA: hypothetical protein PLH94_05560 [Fimbriimonadaceae bacterium]|nr:hypothetical protein [Fimbriimonadaceae bacterium]